MSTGAAVVGTGFGCLTHVRALRAAGFEVHALVGRDADKTAARAARFEIPHACTSLADALRVPGVDAVTIATPPHTHADLCLEAVEAGKHVLCEKPFTRDAAEARAVLAAAEQAGVVHFLGTEFRFAPGQALLARTIRGGAIGAPRLATFLLHIPLLAGPDVEVPGWWSDADQGGGWLGAQASHVIDQIRSTLGEFATVSASLPHVGDHPWTAEDAYLAHFQLRDGCVGFMQSVASDRGPMLFATRVAGTDGTAWAEGDRVQVADAGGTRDVPAPADLAVGAPDPPPADLLVERVRPAALDRPRPRPVHAPRRAVPRSHRGPAHARRSGAGDVRRRRRDHERARRDPAIGAGRPFDRGREVTGVVVVGTGFGCLTHVPALRGAGLDVVALVGRDPDKTARRAEAVGVPRACTSFDDALALPGADAVTVATPPNTHAPLVLHALRKGKHVLCEKPFARDATEGRTMLAAARHAGVVHLLGTEFRFDTGQALLARAIARRALSAIPGSRCSCCTCRCSSDADARLPEWWADAAQGGGWLGAHGSQVIDQIRVTLGEFEAVTAAVVRIARRTTADDGFVVHFRTRSGVAGVMQSTAADRGPMLIETRVVGTRGTAWIEGVGDTVRVADARGARRLDIPDDLRTAPPASPPPELLTTAYEQMTGHGFDLGPYTRLAEHFRARIEGTEPPPGPAPATFEDGVADMVVLDGMRRSAAERRTVVFA